METKRQLQVAETIKRNFGVLLQHQGAYVYGHDVLVTVTDVKISPDFSLAKVYLSIYNTEDKQSVIEQMQENVVQLRQMLGQRIRRHVRRIPELAFYEDNTLDEMWRLNQLFDRLHDEHQMGEEE